MTAKEKIENLLTQLLPICESWIQEKDGQSYFIDPIDGEEILAHYGATHVAAALIIWGKLKARNFVCEKGVKLLNDVLNRWDACKTLPAFHFDFNNFALCLVEDTLKEVEPNLADRIRKVVIQTADSNHDTTNWLPMRWFVNKKRYEWTEDVKFLKRCDNCKRKIKTATNADGGIEDRMPKGLSFNLQYDVATVGVLQFLRIQGDEYDLSKELHFLLNAVAPDGDINYQGRGCNQIFAWSLWVYLLASSGREKELERALKFLDGKVQTMFLKHNLMLNEYDGTEKHLWWDYHYCSVYSAHFLLWLTLSLLDYNKSCIDDCHEQLPDDTGLHIYRSDDYFVAVFDGRKEYLAEQGPSVCALWTKTHGFLFKGSFGPWQGLFGNLHCPQETVINNYFGPICVKWNKDFQNNRIIRRFLPRLRSDASVTIKPIFVAPVIRDDSKYIILGFKIPEGAVLNIPLLSDAQWKPLILGKSLPVQVREDLLIRNQYGMLKVYRSVVNHIDTLFVQIDK